MRIADLRKAGVTLEYTHSGNRSLWILRSKDGRCSIKARPFTASEIKAFSKR